MQLAREDEMTKRFMKLVGPAAVAATLALSGVSAEAADIRARVPFDFTVKGKTLKAGAYNVSDSGGILMLNSATGGVFVLTTRVGSSSDRQPRLVFERYGDTYVLRQAWTGVGGYQLPQSKSEREAAKLARKGQTAAAETNVIPAL